MDELSRYSAIHFNLGDTPSQERALELQDKWVSNDNLAEVLLLDDNL